MRTKTTQTNEEFMRRQKKKIISIGIILAIILAPFYGYSVGFAGQAEGLPGSKVLNKGSLLGVVYFRNDGTACGLVEGDEIQSVAPSAKAVWNAQDLDLKEKLKEDLVRYNISACDSLEDLKTIKQVAQGLQESVQVASSNVLLSGLGIGVLSSAGACVFGGLAKYFDEHMNDILYPRASDEASEEELSEEAKRKLKFKYGLAELGSNLMQVLFVVGGMGVTGSKVWKTGAVKGSFAGILTGAAASWSAYECANFIDFVY